MSVRTACSLRWASASCNWDVAKHDGEPEALPGIGDDAVYSGVLETVFFLKNGVLFAVVAGPFFSEAATKKAAGIELAKVILGKL